MTRINWRKIEKAAAAQIVAAVRAVREQHPDEHVYGAVIYGFYGDGETIAWPGVAVGTDESLAKVLARYEANGYEREGLDADLRWSGPDLTHNIDPSSAEHALAEAVHTAAARSGAFDEWESAYERFLLCFPAAALRARKMLLAKKVVEEEFLAIAFDEGGDLVPLSLTGAQLARHFPQYGSDDTERARLAALPVRQRVIELLPEAVTPTHKGLLIGEHSGLLVACGVASVPALASVVRGEVLPAGAAAAARLLARINIDTPEVIDALDELMRRTSADNTARAWAARALARLGRSDLILARVSELPAEFVVTGLANPFRASRDDGAHRPLDYAPLEAALRENPHLESELEKELSPGSAFCALDRDEIPIARAALESPWQVIRTHARVTLEDAGVKL